VLKFLKKYHKWIGVIITLILVIYAISGIVLNHRQLFSSIDVNRKYLPDNLSYKNWNLAAVKGTESIGKDSVLVYGNIGIWLTDSTYTNFTDFSQGFPKGTDNKKICKIYKTKQGKLFAGSLFGLFEYEFLNKKWKKIPINLHNPRIVDITEKQDTLLVLSRSYLLKSVDFEKFTKHSLPEPENYDNKVGLFKTLWLIHSGEIYGNIGKLFVDLIGVIFIFLTITGFILFINTYRIKGKKKKKKDLKKLHKSNRWNLKWHNKIGWTTLVFLSITTITGMFLRPPLLIPIAESRVEKIPHTLLDTDNPWFDQLRRIIYDKKNNQYIIATNSGAYFSDVYFTKKLIPFDPQPPISVMGVNAFEKMDDESILIGSFEGLFVWDAQTGKITDYIKKEAYQKPKRKGSPIGEHLISGYIKDYKGATVYFDYSKGSKAVARNHKFPPMPEIIRNQPMSLWNVMLEVHTGRIFQSLMGLFYILIVPITGLLTLFVLISGTVVWYKKHR